MKVRNLYIDADHILHLVASDNPKNSLDGEVLEFKPDMKALKRKFNNIVLEYENIIAVEVVAKKFKLGETFLIFSDPESNFRKEIFPGYKAGRPKKSETFYALRRWAIRKHGCVKNAEADDEVAYHVRHGGIGISTDKDLLKGVPGRWYDPHHMRGFYAKTKKKEAKRFVLLQTLMGDSTDKIPGIPGVGIKTAEKLLDQYGATWDGVIAAYESKGLGENEAILTRRLIGMDQWCPEKGIKLWKP